MNEPSACAICGERLDSVTCRVCGGRWPVRPGHRQIVLLALLVLLAAVMFPVTRAVALRNRELRRVDGQTLYERARRELEAEEPDRAVETLRRAVATDPSSRDYRLALARALDARNDSAEARALLEGLLAEGPDDPEVSLHLARLDAADDRWDAALQHYQHTLVALWSADRLDARRAVRMELIAALLGHDARRRALSELLILSAELPQDPDLQTAAGRMYLDAGEPRRAFDHFDQALRLDDDHAGALAGAGEALFAQGDYARARRFFAALDGAPAITDLLAVTDLVLDGDPLAPRLALAERRRRLSAMIAHARPAVDRCLAAAGDAPGRREVITSAEVLAALDDRSSPPLRSVDDVEHRFELVYRAQRSVSNACGDSTPMGRAILLAAARHQLDQS